MSLRLPGPHLLGSVLCLSLALPPAVAAKTAASLPVVCTASLKAKGAVTGVAACEAVRRALAASLRRPVHLAVGAASGPGDHLRVSVHVPRRDGVELRAAGRLRGRSAGFGPIGMDVMDRALTQSDVERLAVRMAESLAGR